MQRKDGLGRPSRARKVIVELFAGATRAEAESVAVVAAGRSLTYTMLDRASDVLARRLVELGVTEGALVAVMTERTAEIAIAYLAILKSGGAFLPLSIDAPALRNQMILRESRVGLVLTTTEALSRCEAAEQYRQTAHLLDIKTLAGCGRAPMVFRDSVPANTAYVIHTSGTTGEPKGAINADSALLNLVTWLAEEIYPGGTERLNVAVVAPFVFDPSIQQIFGALLRGHCLHIVPEAARFDGGALLAFLNAGKIDIADGTPTHLRLLANAPASLGNRLSPRLLLIGGEAMTPDIVRTFWARFGGAERSSIVNLYGTAECAVDATFHKVEPGETERLGFVPIGRALPNVSVSILDDAGKRLPDAQIGEIAIGGAAVGLGYLGRPAMTRERFGQGPDGSPIYRTGDLGRAHAGGLLECLGRRDRQVKIRGARIEPAEIELALRNFRRNGLDRDVAYCERCLLDTQHPGVTVTEGVCSVCARFDAHRDRASRYFCTSADFIALMEAARTDRVSGGHDCLLLYSGGKDSSYVLLRLI
jgi:amino acid adenylation domain-containing protein